MSCIWLRMTTLVQSSFFDNRCSSFSETLGTENVQTGAARIELGGVLLREQRYPEAEAELLAGYRIGTSRA